MTQTPIDYLTLRQNSVFFELSSFRTIAVKGKDAATYLQSQTTQDIVALVKGELAPNALVDRKAHVKSLFLTLCIDPHSFLLVAHESCSEALFEHLEAFHFVEELTLEWDQDPLSLYLGPTAIRDIKIDFELSSIPSENIWQKEDLIFASTDFFGELGVLVLGALPQAFNKEISDLALLSLIQFEGGKAQWGVDISTDNILPETGWQTSAVSYDKGCYLGQEVIARIKTYGVVPKALVYLLFEEDELPDIGPIEINGKAHGFITQVSYSPAAKSWVAMAYIHKKHREMGTTLEFSQSNKSFQGKLKALPLKAPLTRSQYAQRLYDEALDTFANDQEAEALPLLEQAIDYDPNHADAYESLGVILSRQGNHEAAIEVMTQLTQLAPEVAMAHTNLSRFYMLVGDKETAEFHMAEATKLSMKAQFKEQKAKQVEAEAEQAKLQMIEMFKEVLETVDSDDLVANYGLGKSLHDLEKYEDAKPYLKKATELDKLYSSAFLYYGKTLLALGENELAQTVLKQGIHAATEKGDLMPLNQMDQLLKDVALLPERR